MNAAKILIWVMSGLLLAGLGVLVVGLSLGWHQEEPTLSSNNSGPISSFELLNLNQPAGSEIEGVTALGNQIAVTVSGGGLPQRLVLVELESGTIVGTIMVNVNNEKP